jgi:hypothetical protein
MCGTDGTMQKSPKYALEKIQIACNLKGKQVITKTLENIA